MTTINVLTTQDKRTNNADAIAQTYYEYHGEYSDALDNEYNSGFIIVDAEGAWTA